jgi:hypothetical protein
MFCIGSASDRIGIIPKSCRVGSVSDHDRIGSDHDRISPNLIVIWSGLVGSVSVCDRIGVGYGSGRDRIGSDQIGIGTVSDRIGSDLN